MLKLFIELIPVVSSSRMTSFNTAYSHFMHYQLKNTDLSSSFLFENEISLHLYVEKNDM